MSVPPVLFQQNYARSPPDLILTAGPERHEIPVHRIVLFCSSPFFERMVHYRISGRLVGIRDDSLRFDFPFISHGVMMQIVKYCYSGVVDVTGENVKELMSAADMFVMENIIHACQSFQEAASQVHVSQAVSRSSVSSYGSKTKRRWNPMDGGSSR